MIKIGYTTTNQGKQPLINIGCTKIMVDERGQQLERLIRELKPDQTLIFYQVTDIGISLAMVLKRLSYMNSKNLSYEVAKENLSTTKLLSCSAWIDFLKKAQTKIQAKQTLVGLAQAATLGQYPGRPRKLNPEQAKDIYEQVTSGWKMGWLARKYSVSKRTIERVVERQIKQQKGKAERAVVGSRGD